MQALARVVVLVQAWVAGPQSVGERREARALSLVREPVLAARLWAQV